MDALTELMRSFKVESTIFSQACLTAPWGVYARPMASGIFHAVLHGSCWMVPEHAPEQAVRLQRGDVIFLPHGHGHTMCDHPEREAVPIHTLAEERPDHHMDMLRVEGGGARTELICGLVHFAQGEGHPLLEVLPPVIRVSAPASETPGDEAQESAGRPVGEGAEAARWVHRTLDLIRGELDAPVPGGQLIITRLADVLLVQALRAWLLGGALEQGTWVAGLRDSRVARALAHMHRDPGESWTVDRLARRVGMSRSGFSTRFVELVGLPPYRYLKQWRIRLASEALQTEEVTLSELAHRLGYSSEFALSKAFKQVVGVAPDIYRQAARSA